MDNSKPKQNYYSVVKHNDLIEARYKLTLHEQKLVVTVASMVKPDDVDFHEYRISVKEFREMMDVKGHNYHIQIRQKSKTLLKKPLAIPHDRGELYCNWFSSIDYLNREGVIVFCFDPKLRPYMLGLKRKFTEYKARNIMQLHSGYSIRIYELLKQYLPIGERTINLYDLKRILGVEGMYEKYANVKQSILEPAKNEINGKKKADGSSKTNGTDIIFRYEPIKTGRKTTAIHFIIWPNPNCQEPERPTIPEEQAILEKVPPPIRNVAKKALKKRGIKATQEIMTYGETQIKKGKVRDVEAYLATCFSNGYGAKTKAERTADQEREAKVAELRRQADQLEQEAKTETQRRKETIARQNFLLAALTPDQDAELSRLAEIEIQSNDFDEKRYRIQKKAGKTILIDRYKRGLVEDFMAHGAPGRSEADPTRPQEMTLPGF